MARVMLLEDTEKLFIAMWLVVVLFFHRGWYATPLSVISNIHVRYCFKPHLKVGGLGFNARFLYYIKRLPGLKLE